MNRSHEEMKSMGLGGIFLDSCKVMYRARKIFSIILISLALPWMMMASFHSTISPKIDHIVGNYSKQVNAALERYTSPLMTTLNKTLEFSKNHTEFIEENTNASYSFWLTNSEEFKLEMVKLVEEQMWNLLRNDATYALVSDLVPDNPSGVLLVLLFELARFVFSWTTTVILTAEVAHAIVSMHNSEELPCKKLFTVSPKIWKRLLVTYLCPYVLSALGLVVMGALTGAGVFFRNLFTPNISLILVAMWFPIGIAFLIFPFVRIVFDVAVVVTALEGTCGVKAVKKSVALMKGNILAGAVIFILKVFVDNQMDRVNGRLWDLSGKDVMGIALWGIKVSAAFGLGIFVISVHTFFYMRCKSYHGEKIVMAAPSDS